MGIIKNGSDTPLNIKTGTVPDVSGALENWFQPLTFIQVVKTSEAFQVVETETEINFRGTIQPFTDRELILKPEGQRAWTWYWIHSDTSLSLNVDEIINYNGVRMRIMSRKDYAIYGYYEYNAIQDWDQQVVPPPPSVDYDGGDAFTTVYDLDLDGGDAFGTGTDEVDGGNAFYD